MEFLVPAKCIYCDAEFNPERGRGDHVIPAALGRFTNEFRFRGICRKCNNELGRCDDQLLRCGPEAVFKRFVNIRAKEKKRGASATGAHGQPPPRYTIRRTRHNELAEPHGDNPLDIRPVDHVSITGKNGQEHHIRLRRGMTVDQLRAKIQDLVPDGPVESHWDWDDKNNAEFGALIRGVFPDAKIVEMPPTGPGTHKVLGRTICTFHSDYFRALAKIAFHYYLLNSRRGFTGREPTFSRIRHFIKVGGDHREFFERPGPRFALPFGVLPDGRAVMPDRWRHWLAADESGPTISVALDLFIGPMRPPSVHNIELARLGSKSLLVPGWVTSHEYIYDAPGTLAGYSGIVEPLTTTFLGVAR